MSDNELIADFMGWVWPKDPDHKRYEITSLKYHVSWDWLMSVVEKIRKVILPEVRKQIPPNGACKGDLIDVEISCGFMEVSIEIIYRHTVAFIKWYNNSRYNQQKP